nr:MAG TPA: hypothetical protein [Caudoviricetes sp.]
MIIQVKKDYEVTNEDIVDILSAFDCHGWCCTINYNKCDYADARAKLGKDACYEDVLAQILFDGGVLEFVDSDDPSIRYELKLLAVYSGIKRAIEKEYYSDYNWYEDGKLNTCQIDSAVADVIVQLGLFGQVVYG